MAAVDDERPAVVSIASAVEHSGASVVKLSGELDISNVDSLKHALAAVLAERPDTLVFDLQELTFMDSAGIAVLVDAAERVGTVRLRAVTPVVRRIIELTGLTGVLPIDQ